MIILVLFGVPRVIRYPYPGAVYHLMARGHGGMVVFENDDDRKGFLFLLGKVCVNATVGGLTRGC